MKDKQNIKNNFSRYASTYDRHSALQVYCAQKLLGFLPGHVAGAVLDIGCGTGMYTGELAVRYPHNSIAGIDISSEMIKIAREKIRDKRVVFAVEDIEDFECDSLYSLVTSNAGLQWVSDLRDVFLRCSRLLEDKGVFAASIFGPETYFELEEVFSCFLDDSFKVAASFFSSEEEVRSCAQDIFGDLRMQTHTYTQRYDDLISFLKDIKYTGTTGGLMSFQRLKRADILKAEKIYKDRFGHITASSQIFFITGIKK